MAAQIAGSVVLWFPDPSILDDPLGEGGDSLMSQTILAVVQRLTEPRHATSNSQTVPTDH